MLMHFPTFAMSSAGYSSVSRCDRYANPTSRSMVCQRPNVSEYMYLARRCVHYRFKVGQALTLVDPVRLLPLFWEQRSLHGEVTCTACEVGRVCVSPGQFLTVMVSAVVWTAVVHMPGSLHAYGAHEHAHDAPAAGYLHACTATSNPEVRYPWPAYTPHVLLWPWRRVVLFFMLAHLNTSVR